MTGCFFSHTNITPFSLRYEVFWRKPCAFHFKIQYNKPARIQGEPNRNSPLNKLFYKKGGQGEEKQKPDTRPSQENRTNDRPKQKATKEKKRRLKILYRQLTSPMRQSIIYTKNEYQPTVFVLAECGVSLPYYAQSRTSPPTGQGPRYYSTIANRYQQIKTIGTPAIGACSPPLTGAC